MVYMKERIGHILFHRHLLWEFLRRDLQARYIGSAMGFFWSVINPLVLLIVYTFVFGVILKAKYEHRGLIHENTIRIFPAAENSSQPPLPENIEELLNTRFPGWIEFNHADLSEVIKTLEKKCDLHFDLELGKEASPTVTLRWENPTAREILNAALGANDLDRAVPESGIFAFAFYIFTGLLPWYAFQESLVRSTTCIIDNAHLIKQVRFPAKVIPTYLTLSSITNQLIGTGIFLIVLLGYYGSLQLTLVALPLVLVLEMIFFLGAGLLFATLNTYLRDIGPLVSIGTMLMMWSTPMLYPIEMVPDSFLPLIYSNPITYMIVIHHDLVLHGIWPGIGRWIAFGAISLVTFILGYWTFTRCHREFADLI